MRRWHLDPSCWRVRFRLPLRGRQGQILASGVLFRCQRLTLSLRRLRSCHGYSLLQLLDSSDPFTGKPLSERAALEVSRFFPPRKPPRDPTPQNSSGAPSRLLRALLGLITYGFTLVVTRKKACTHPSNMSDIAVHYSICACLLESAGAMLFFTGP